MIWRALALTLATLAVSPALAQTIVARSGEHDGFSRLVLRLPDGVGWSLSQSGQSASLTIEAPAVVDTSRVFDLIPRNRLKAISQNGAGQPVTLQLGCDCEISTFKQRDGYLVIDIKDGEADRTYASETGVLPLGTPVGASGYRFNLPLDTVSAAQIERDLANALSGRATGAALTVPKPMPVAEAKPEPVPAPDVSLPNRESLLHENLQTGEEMAQLPSVDLLLDMDETARAAMVNASEHRLLQQIGRATNQGLLDLVITEVSEQDAQTVIAPLSTQRQSTEPLDHINVMSAIDRETRALAAATAGPPPSPLCIPTDRLAIYEWGSDDSFADQIGPLRTSLFKEFDALDTKAVLMLAKTYLYFGFGAEARAALHMLPEGEDTAAILALADIMDGNELPVTHAFAGQQKCEGDSAFWAALADGAIKDNANTDAIQQTFAKMPPHLRVHLGPAVTTLFAHAGDPHMAAATLRSVDRTGVEVVPSINMAEAAVAELEGDTDAVAEELTEELASRTENSPQALIDLINLSFEERKALSPDLPDVVASYEMESRDAAIGTSLRQAEAVALSLTGQFDAAFFALENLSDLDGPAARAEAIRPIFTLLTERADDVTFLQYALTFAERATAKEAAPVAELVTRRLLDLGFAQQAQSMLMKTSLEPTNETRRLMMAETALGLDLPHRALVELMGLDSPEANRLRARALWRNGEFNRAGEFLLAEQDTNQAARGFWHSGNNESITGSEETRFGQVAGVTVQIGQSAEDPGEMTPLAHARALMESSVGTRDHIQSLLRAVQPEVQATN